VLRFVLQEMIVLLGGSDCEELVGVITGDDGVRFWEGYSV